MKRRRIRWNETYHDLKLIDTRQLLTLVGNVRCDFKIYLHLLWRIEIEIVVIPCMYFKSIEMKHT